jgi:thioesterase domain-containing protein
VLAFEIARQLHILGNPAKGLILLDSPFPIDHEPLPDAVVGYVAGTAFKAHSDIRSYIEAQFKRNAGLLKVYRPPRQEIQIPTVMLLSGEACDTATLCGLKYAWLDDQEFRKNTTQEWSTIVGKTFETMEVEGNHFNMFAAEHVSIPGASGDKYMC